MKRHERLLTALPICATLLLFGGCGDGKDSAAPTTSTSLRSTTIEPAAPTVPPGGRVVEISFRDGKVDGPTQVETDRGEVLTLRVTSDVMEEVHVHTYDLHAALEPGVAEEITFTAGVPGRHEVELEGTGKRLLTVLVR